MAYVLISSLFIYDCILLTVAFFYSLGTEGTKVYANP